jgi:hypothetical protein
MCCENRREGTNAFALVPPMWVLFCIFIFWEESLLMEMLLFVLKANIRAVIKAIDMVNQTPYRCGTVSPI